MLTRFGFSSWQKNSKLVMTYSLFFILILGGIKSTFAITQQELNKESCNKFKKIDSELSVNYKKILVLYQSDQKFIDKFKLAQKQWLAYRDAHLDSIYPDEDSHVAYGSINPMCRCMILEELTKDRIKQINVWLDGIEEGDACAGSIKIRPE